MADTFNLDPDVAQRWAQQTEAGAMSMQHSAMQAQQMLSTIKEIAQIQQEMVKQQPTDAYVKMLGEIRHQLGIVKDTAQSINFVDIVRSISAMSSGFRSAADSASKLREVLKEIAVYKERILQLGEKTGQPVWAAKQVQGAGALELQMTRGAGGGYSRDKGGAGTSLSVVKEEGSEQRKNVSSVELLINSFKIKNEFIRQQIELVRDERKEVQKLTGDVEDVKEAQKESAGQGIVGDVADAATDIASAVNPLTRVLGVGKSILGAVGNVAGVFGVGLNIKDWLQRLIKIYDELRLINGASKQIASTNQPLVAGTKLLAGNLGEANASIWRMRVAFSMTAKEAAAFQVSLNRMGMEMKDVAQLDTYMKSVELLRGVSVKEQYGFIKAMKTEYGMQAESAARLHMHLMNVAQTIPDMSMEEVAKDVQDMTDSVKIFNVSLLDTAAVYTSVLTKADAWLAGMKNVPRSVQKDFVKQLTAMPIELPIEWRAALGKGKGPAEQIMEFTLMPEKKKEGGYQLEVYKRIVEFLQKNIRSDMSTADKFVSAMVVLENFFKGPELQTILAKGFAGGELNMDALNQAMLEMNNTAITQQKSTEKAAKNWEEFKTSMVGLGSQVAKDYKDIRGWIDNQLNIGLADTVSKLKPSIDQFVDALPGFIKKAGDVIDQLWRFGKYMERLMGDWRDDDDQSSLESKETGMSKAQITWQETLQPTDTDLAKRVNLFTPSSEMTADEAKRRWKELNDPNIGDQRLMELTRYKHDSTKAVAWSNALLQRGFESQFGEGSISTLRKQVTPITTAITPELIRGAVEKTQGERFREVASREGTPELAQLRYQELVDEAVQRNEQEVEQRLQQMTEGGAFRARAGVMGFAKTEQGKWLEQYGYRGQVAQIQMGQLMSRPELLKEIIENIVGGRENMTLNSVIIAMDKLYQTGEATDQAASPLQTPRVGVVKPRKPKPSKPRPR